MIRPMIPPAACLLPFVLLSSCTPRPSGPDGNRNDNSADDRPLPDYVVDPALYMAAIDPERVVSVDPGEGDPRPIRFPVDQLMLLMTEGASRADAVAAAGVVHGQIIGQVLDDGVYQLGVPTTTRAELDEAIALAVGQPRVEAAFYNVMLFETQCPAECDLDQQLFMEQERCPFIDIDYYNALTIFDHVRPQIALHPVVVAVIDSGIQQDNGEFDEVPMVNLSNPNARCTGRDAHGTMVASVIAADDDGAGINGLASRMLDNGMVLLADVTSATDFAEYYASTSRALQAGAEIVNMSFGHPAELAGADLSGYRRSWERLFAAHGNTLFVVAADNRPYEITATNYAPAGIDLPNVITVGGTNMCNPDEVYPNSAFGPLIDMAAPAVSVPVSSFDNGHEISLAFGNSVAAPMVVSLAAILKAIDPRLSPRQIKEEYIMTYGGTAPLAVGGVRAYFSPPILQALLDRAPAAPTEVVDLIDADLNGRHDVPGMVINRLCGGLQYSVSGYGSYDYSGAEMDDPSSDINVVGEISPMSFDLQAYAGPDASLLLGCIEGFECTFELNKSYAIAEDADDVPGTIAVAYTQHPDQDVPDAIGIGVSGSVIFDSCRVEQRVSLGNRIIEVSVTGRFSGALRVANIPSDTTSMADMEGYFTVPFATLGLSPDEPVYQYLEGNCEGGYAAPP